MSYNKKNIIETITQEVEKLNYLPVDIITRGDARNLIVEVYVDNDLGISTADCKKINSHLNYIIEANNLIEQKYRLDVSSPGVDRPLKFLMQFSKHINREFSIEYLEDNSISKFTGKLIKIDKDNLIFKSVKEEKTVNFSMIKKAKVLISF